MESIADRFWLWGHAAGSHNGQYNLPAASRVSPPEAARYMGIGNVIMVGYGGKPEPPFDPLARELAFCRRVVWSIIGDASSTRNDRTTDLEEVVALARRFPNIRGAIMDDFFGEGQRPRYDLEAVGGFANRLHAAGLDLWVVVYDGQLVPSVVPHVRRCDVLTFWTWEARNLVRLEESFEKLEALVPGARICLGCYLWDYGGRGPMPLSLMRRQCERGLEWLRAGRIEGMIFLASCICDLSIESVEWTRAWIAQLHSPT